MKKEKRKFKRGKLFKTLIFVGMFAFIPLVFVGCKSTDPGTGTGSGSGSGSESGSGAQNYEINYNLNGGTNSDSNPDTFNSDMSGLTLSEPTRAGYIFRGWYSDINFTNKITSIDVNTKGSITIYAKWEIEEYSITYDLDGGTIDGTNPTSYTIEDTIDGAISLQSPTKEGHTFDGWYLDENFTGDKIEAIEQGATGNKTLFAKFVAFTYTVKFNSNSEYAQGSMEDQAFTCGVTQALSGNAFTRTGYGFAGWAKSESGSKVYNDEAEVLNLITENGGTVELFAVWEAIFEIENRSITGLTAYGKKLTTIEIPSSIDGSADITKIGAEAFKDAAIISVTIPNSITKIDNSAFSGCISLKSIVVPESVSSIGKSAFEGCTSLESISISYMDYCLGYYFGGGVYSDNPFYVPSSLKTVVITENSHVTGRFYGCSSLESITLPSSYNKVVDYEFSGCTSLKSITIPSNVASIGSSAFYGCTSLKSITIPKKVTSIGNYAFYGCSGLETVTFGENSVLTTIGQEAFDGCTSLKSITIPEKVASIGNYAFYGCSSLETVAFGENSELTTIGQEAFDGCTSLTRVAIPNSVTSISYKAFASCSGLTSIFIPSSVTSMYSDVFENCDNSLVICCGASSKPSDWKSDWNDMNSSTGSKFRVIWNAAEEVSLTSDSAFKYVVLNDGTVELVEYVGTETTVEIPSTIEEKNVSAIHDECFYNNTSITSVTIPSSVTIVGNYAFYGCSSLKTVTFDDNSQLVVIRTRAFDGCSSLETVTFGENSELISIWSYAFSGCSSLTGVTIPEKVTSINQYAFNGCTALEEIKFNANLTTEMTSSSNVFYDSGKNGDGITVTFGEGVTSIPAYLFYVSSSSNAPKVASVTIPSSVTSIGGSAFQGCSSLTSVTFEEGSQLTSIGGYAFRDCTSLTGVTIPSSVASIGGYAFSYCSSLETVAFGENSELTSIESSTFGDCTSLTGVTIPEKVASINKYAFSGCTALAEINFNAIECADFSSNSYAFRNVGDENGMTVTFGKGVKKVPAYLFYVAERVKSVTISSSVTSIGEYAFRNCSGLTSVTFEEGSQLTSIGEQAFYNCTSLTSITIPEKVTSIGKYAFSVCTGIEEINFNAKACANFAQDSYAFGASVGQNGNGITVTFGEGVETIPRYMLYNVAAVKTVKISSSVTSIESVVFEGCSSLTSLIIEKGSQLTSIGYNAFNGCSRLTAVFYGGTEDEWTTLSSNVSGITYLANATKYYYSETQPETSGNYWHYDENGVPTPWTSD